MKKKTVLILILILMVSLIVCLVGLIKIKNVRNSKENLEYINSDELDEGTVSPSMIHVVIALYEGDLNPKAISKSTYHFINHLVPEYLKKCTNEEITRKYFQKNKNDIYLDIGIDEETKFIDLINEISKLSGDLEFESSRFDKDNVIVNTNGTEAILYIKYKNNEEIAVKVKLLNKVYSNKTSVQFLPK